MGRVVFRLKAARGIAGLAPRQARLATPVIPKITQEEITEASLFKTRTRMISFRLSEEEYVRVRDMSLVEHARSVSDYARSALCGLPGGNAMSRDGKDPRVDGLEGAVTQLRADLQQLRQLIEHALAGGPAGSERSHFQEDAGPGRGARKSLAAADRGM